LAMTAYAQHVYPVRYQWRRVLTCVGVAAGLTVAARAAHLGLLPSFLLVGAYPLVLLPLGFYLPAERRRLRGLIRLPACTARDQVAQHEHVHARLLERLHRLRRGHHDRLVLVERGVEHDRHAGLALELLDQLVVARVRRPGHGLQAARVVDV